MFDDTSKVHNKIICQENCTSLSNDEIKRVSGQKDKFQHNWLQDKAISFCSKTTYWWLVYVEGCEMYCLLCKKHHTINSQNKASSFGDIPSVRMKKSALTDHIASKKHQGAIEAEMLSRVSVFQKELTEKSQVENNVLFMAFSAMYWLAKEGIANEKISTLLKLLENIGLSEMKFFQHRSRASLRDIFTTLGLQTENDLVEKVKAADCFSVLLDDSSDVSTIEQMICYVNFWNGKSNACDINFLFIENVLKNASSANAENLYKVVKSKLISLGLDMSKLSGISTDGASVMVGKKGGLVKKLKDDNPALVAIHCICHRLALACIDTCGDLQYIKEMEGHMTHIWKIFHYSPVKLAALMKAQTEVHKMTLSEPARKLLTRTMKKACQTRWLSFNNAVQSLYQELVPVIQTLNMFSGDATSYGLMKKITQLKFIGTLYILQSVLPILSDLSKLFQKGNVNFSMICPGLESTQHKLRSLSKDDIFDSLRADLSPNGRLGTLDVTVSEFTMSQLAVTMSKYVDALCKNIDARFQQSPHLAAFAVFDIRCLPERGTDEFSQYGSKDIHILADHFFGTQEDTEEMLAEWINFKFNLSSWKKEVPMEILNCKVEETPMEWALKKLLIMKTSMIHFFPHLVKVAEIIMTLPVSNAWPERGFSRMKLVKTCLRNRLQNDILQSLLHISLNGPSLGSKEADSYVKKSVTTWLSAKPRRKLPKVKPVLEKEKEQDPADPVAVASCSTQTEEASNLDLVQLEYDKAVRVLQLAKFAQKVVSGDGIADDFEYEEDNDDDDNDFDVCNDY
ncbi:zinc finger protein 862-like [Mytilus galloprovincialis]|uniref:zinc finger protein 862-like n=1 Tax=Mytilus galloprovincialis TaxID=29158 RepID=UPI003F7C5C22